MSNLSATALSAPFISSCEGEEPLQPIAACIVTSTGSVSSSADKHVYYEMANGLQVYSVATDTQSYNAVVSSQLLYQSLCPEVTSLLSIVPGEIMPYHNEYIGCSTSGGDHELIIYASTIRADFIQKRMGLHSAALFSGLYRLTTAKSDYIFNPQHTKHTK